MARPALAAVAAVAVVAAACSSGGDELSIADVEPIETNDGGVLVKPPDVLEGDPAPTRPPLDDELELTPIVPFEYFDGTPASTAEFTGRPTVINFWASNCAPCVAEMPEFEAVYQELGDRVDFVGMNVADVSREAAVALAEQTGVTYPLADDTTSAVFREFRGFVMPTTVFLTAGGQVGATWSGVLTGEELTRLINEHILSEQE